MSENTVLTERCGAVYAITLNSPEVKNAVDTPTAERIAAACVDFDADDSLRVAVFHGANGTLCAGADL